MRETSYAAGVFGRIQVTGSGSMRLMLAVVALSLTIMAAGASAASASEAPYGEVTRFGGYDATGSTPGKFTTPVGFAVEPKNPATGEENAVYVLDLTKVELKKKGELGQGEGFLFYRLQKLSKAGAVLGSTSFTEKFTDTEKFIDAHPLFGLAVDPANKRVYTIVQSMVEETEENETVPVVDELVAWNSTPDSKGELEGATGFSADSITKSASLVAGESALQPSSTEAAKDLYSPNGIAVDTESTGQAGDVVIEAQEGIRKSLGGPTLLKEVDPLTGKVVDSWRAGTVAPADQQGDGLFAATDKSGAFGVGLYDGAGSIARVATVSGDFKSESLLAEEDTKGSNVDEAASLDLENTSNKEDAHERVALEEFTAGSPVVQLTGGAHLYAALYAHKAGGPSLDSQGEVEPWQAWVGGTAPSESWMTGQIGEGFDKGWAHLGVRLFEANGRIVNTLGGGEPNTPAASQLGTCSIDFAAASLAAGEGGAVFVLTQPNHEGPRNKEEVDGDEVIEFAPGGTYSCPSVTHDIEVNGTEVHTDGGQSMPEVTVDAGVKTKFDAISLDQPLAWSPAGLFTWNPKPVEWTPFAIEWGWNFEHEGTAGPNKDGYTETKKIEAGNENKYLWPDPEAEHEYATTGTYEARARVYGDYGTSVFPVKVTVLSAKKPVASFIPPSGIVAEKASVFNASASTPAAGAKIKIEVYEWNFGDGHVELTGSSTESHKYATAGKYPVTLTVHDNEGAEPEASVTHEVVVGPPEKQEKQEPPAEEKHAEQPKAEEKHEEQSKSETGSKEGTTTPIITPPHKETKALTTAQKLSAALKACKKLKSHKKRASCEKQAKKRYAPPSKHGRKKK